MKNYCLIPLWQLGLNNLVLRTFEHICRDYRINGTQELIANYSVISTKPLLQHGVSTRVNIW